MLPKRRVAHPIGGQGSLEVVHLVQHEPGPGQAGAGPGQCRAVHGHRLQFPRGRGGHGQQPVAGPHMVHPVGLLDLRRFHHHVLVVPDAARGEKDRATGLDQLHERIHPLLGHEPQEAARLDLVSREVDGAVVDEHDPAVGQPSSDGLLPPLLPVAEVGDPSGHEVVEFDLLGFGHDEVAVGVDDMTEALVPHHPEFDAPGVPLGVDLFVLELDAVAPVFRDRELPRGPARDLVVAVGLEGPHRQAQSRSVREARVVDLGAAVVRLLVEQLHVFPDQPDAPVAIADVVPLFSLPDGLQAERRGALHHRQRVIGLGSVEELLQQDRRHTPQTPSPL